MPQQSIGYLMVDIMRLLRREFQQRSELSCLTLAQARALKCVSMNEGIRQVELAEILEIKPMTLVRVIDQLVAAGFLTRQRDPADRRAHLIHTTPEAKPVQDKVMQASQEVWERALTGLSEAQIDNFMLVLQSVHNNLSKE
ncbi:MarR family winged helix-turn-helix transcriptional regulator [Shewanella dokdonensis]|uniref:MarR family transcriptional regulator n=1 Tax=Shewanella dokdonensis TaxID=712036 RepID=A0ABX8DJK1_9GAMM|nr:MarR family transcriptional regulator [Shewanella dokdonensis]MCL1075834.1 MarR family transcriptional regulator [Shewanella dokdonensis]QVK24171.1 MarR family transcriptional regulator [Shewanella dokdonensis]